MHQLNVLALGPNSFINTLIELKSYLKFNLSKANNNLDKNSMANYDILVFHEEFLQSKNIKNIIDNLVTIKILASSSFSKNHTYDALLKLPTSINEINFIIKNSVIKKKFIKNSSIKIKNYFLDKNEKKLSKNDIFVILTEKEIQLLELFLNNTLSISKKEILSKVWHYSSDADTHTVETHIYRLRKKINDKFSDDQFITNDKNGYSL
ncbi:winged helix-turn-helix domain-containing protein [Pelagibacteraceae bacterium]|nr:winged helix-turn-helix domain-containing protein [Pelagibacteraceae bacterium]